MGHLPRADPRPTTRTRGQGTRVAGAHRAAGSRLRSTRRARAPRHQREPYGMVHASGRDSDAPLAATGCDPAVVAGRRRVAFSRAGATDSVFAGPLGNARAYPVAGVVTGFAWLPDGVSLVVLALEPHGTSTLSRLDLANGHARVVARDLDAPTLFSPVTVAPDGRRAYVALAGSGAPSPEVRHEPHANRQLGIYEMDLGTGNRHAVIPAPQEGDAFAPCVASGYLYWTHAVAEASAVVVPTAGGTVGLGSRGGEVPSWRPDGRQIGFVYGDWRWGGLGVHLGGGALGLGTGR